MPKATVIELPARLNHCSSEGMRDWEQKQRNIERMRVYNNKRLAMGLSVLRYAPELTDYRHE